jgi:aminomethyltransferase
VDEGKGKMKKTPLHQIHKALGAKMIDFAGWEMPVQYSGIIEEHLTTRTKAGLFDISHMGQILFKGPGALQAVQYLATNQAAKLVPGQVQYSALLYPTGTFVDDITVYKFNEEQFMFCVNAANTDKDYAWIQENISSKKSSFAPVQIKNVSEEIALLALQGPKAAEILQNLTEINLSSLKSFRFIEGAVAGIKTWISRTGYTGEDGFELYIPAEEANREVHQEKVIEVWNKLLEAGQEHGLKPVGLGARDTLRLEARLVLYGNDITDQTTPLEADLEWIVKYDKGDFIGREALLKQKEQGIQRKLVGFEMIQRGIARSHYKILKGQELVGEVTSGTYAPYLDKNIGLGYVKIEYSEIGTELDILIRDQKVKAKIVPTPFYKRKK